VTIAATKNPAADFIKGQGLNMNWRMTLPSRIGSKLTAIVLSPTFNSVLNHGTCVIVTRSDSLRFRR
jgi:hypothetical protein